MVHSAHQIKEDKRDERIAPETFHPHDARPVSSQSAPGTFWRKRHPPGLRHYETVSGPDIEALFSARCCAENMSESEIIPMGIGLDRLARSSTTPAHKLDSGGWSRRKVEGLCVELDSPGRAGQYWFNRGGSIALAAGEKIEGDTWVMAPLMLWCIKDGSLRIYADSKRDFEEIKLVEEHPRPSDPSIRGECPG